ncbi:MAG: hypothetical protein II992_05100 [Lachnospiraceae bacterium]|nr:hypothetical protein [Lachnospiraceae bacterium]
MASFEVDFPNNLQKLINDAANFDKIAPKIIEETIPLAEKSMKNALRSHKQTGELIGSIKGKKQNDRYGYITATGIAKGKKYNKKNKSGTKQVAYRNYQKLLALEYGTSKQTATPFLEKAVNACEDKIIEKAQEILENGVSKL